MHIPKRIVRLAKDRALSSFSALAEQTVVEADTQATRAMSSASPLEIGNLNALRAFLRGEGRTLRTRMDRHFAGLLERAMQTMHVDLRTKGGDINYATLTLIDDDVVVRQIEVDRMVARLREAEPVALGRVNLTIALIHNDHEARERENPFRPYLLARALYEALRELMWEDVQSKLLYDALGQAMALRMPGFYAGILDVFESGGITARLVARPTAMSRAERERTAWQSAARHLLGGPDAGKPGGPGADPALHALQERLVPKLQRLRELHRGGDGGVAARPDDLIDVVWNMFHQPKSARPAGRRLRPPVGAQRGELDTVLFSLQQEVAAGQPPPSPLALRDLVGEGDADPQQRRIMDVVALLFESIIHDDLLAQAMHTHLARLYVPFVRAALVEPDLLHDAHHPVRRLVDRLGSVGFGIGAAHPGFAALHAELASVVGAVLDLFDDDMDIFSDAENALDAYVATLLVQLDPRIGPVTEAVAEAVWASMRLTRAVAALSKALQPLQIDPRLADFILGTWARVLSHAGGSSASVELLPELLWSAQEKTTPEDRATMMRMLPGMVKKVREGMAEISLPEAPSKAAFDRLVSVHMDVLGNKQVPARNHMTLDQFRDHFRDFSAAGDAFDTQSGVPGGARGAGGVPALSASAEGWVGKFELEAALLQRGLSVSLHARSAARLPQTSDADWLSLARPGARFEIKVEERYRSALLCAVRPDDTAYLFSIGEVDMQALYLKGPLLEALENSSIRPLEYAPLFDRAVESLMAGAESLAG